MTDDERQTATEFYRYAFAIGWQWGVEHCWEPEEAAAMAVLAMCESLSKFDAARGVSLKQYLRLQIPRGIVDELRRNHYYSRRLDSFVSVSSLDQLSDEDGDTLPAAASHEEEIVDRLHVEGLMRRVEELTADLTAKERSALIAISLGRGAAKAMAAAEGVTEAAYSYRKTNAVARLRAALALEGQEAA